MIEEIKKVKVPGSDIEISELGFGAWAIGGVSHGQASMEEATVALEVYLENGGNFIDTARGYGQSEEIIGSYLAERGLTNKVILATKTAAGEKLSTMDKITEDLEKSLKFLHRDVIDIYYLHQPPEDEYTMEIALNTMEKLKKQGKIRLIGASIKGPDVTTSTTDLCKKYILSNRINVIQLVYSILRQKNQEIFDIAEKHNVGLIGRTALESGFLSGKYNESTKFLNTDHRSRWNNSIPKIIEAVHDIEKHVVEPYDNISQVAIRFAMLPKAIISTIVGAKNREQAYKNIIAYSKPELQKDVISYLSMKYENFTTFANTSPIL